MFRFKNLRHTCTMVTNRILRSIIRGTFRDFQDPFAVARGKIDKNNSDKIVNSRGF